MYSAQRQNIHNPWFFCGNISNVVYLLWFLCFSTAIPTRDICFTFFVFKSMFLFSVFSFWSANHVIEFHPIIFMFIFVFSYILIFFHSVHSLLKTTAWNPFPKILLNPHVVIHSIEGSEEEILHGWTVAPASSHICMVLCFLTLSGRMFISIAQCL